MGRRLSIPRWLRYVLLAAIIVWCTLFLYHLNKPLPPGISVAGPTRPATGFEFLSDLTFQVDGGRVVEQEIFDRVLSMIDEAGEFVVIDMFLFNGEEGGTGEYLPLAANLTERLVARKASLPGLKAIFITDEINNFYGAYTSDEIARLEAAGIQVVTTGLSRLRDSNPVYSAGWRMLAGWYGTGGPGWLPDFLNGSEQKVTARAYLKLLNFKANHRKLIVTDRGCLVASANPHDASSFHSNIAFAGAGLVCADILAGEKAVAAFSGGDVEDWPNLEAGPAMDGARPDRGSVQLVTEGRIREVLLQDLSSVGEGDLVDLAMFYLSDRHVVKALLRAAERGAEIRMILDPTKDAFGREKGGIPNRQVARELVTRSQGRISVRWFDTHGEQFHTKLVMVAREDSTVIMGGSANLTRRNIGDYNLEADLRFVLPPDAPLAMDAAAFFTRVYSNDGGDFSLPFQRYRDDSLLKRIRYRLEEFSGFCLY